MSQQHLKWIELVKERIEEHGWDGHRRIWLSS